jgi:ceramide glucosyltransferase
MPPLMPHWLAFGIEATTTVLAVIGLGYYIAAFLAGRVYVAHLKSAARLLAARQMAGNQIPFPSISILKPLKGLDPSMMEAFRSHCRQNYSSPYELIFGVSSMDDPAAAAVVALQAEFPTMPIQLVQCPERLGANGKVSTLVQMLPYAKHEVILINDSDILVTPHYLERVAAAFAKAPAANTRKAKKRVGLVTALYRGRPHGTLPSRLEALGIATDFQVSVLLSRLIEGVRYGLGSTLAVRRETLEKIGGLRPLVNHLADDYELGKRVSDAGYSVHICAEVVETGVPAYNWSAFINHQLRWARTVRDARPGGYIGLIATHGLAWAMLNLLATGFNPIAVWLFVMVFFMRLALAMSVGTGILYDHEVFPSLLLLPLRDVLHLVIWFSGFLGHAIHWRGEDFVLQKGVLHKIDSHF